MLCRNHNTFDSRAMRKRILPAVYSTMRSLNRQDSKNMYNFSHRLTATAKRLTNKTLHIYAKHSQEFYRLLKSAKLIYDFLKLWNPHWPDLPDLP